MPKGIVSSEFPRYQAVCRTIGVEFDPWQVDLNRCWLGKTADGLYAADTVALSIARQVGKTFDVGAVEFADCILYPKTTVVWTAHRFKVARETFNELRALAKSPKLVPHLEYDDITTAAGNECIPFRNGSRIVFAARERGAIRGFSKVRKLILDEAQILTESVLSDLAPTLNQAENPQIILMGTPPKPTDPGEVFTNIRAEALAGTSEGVLYVEIGADPKADPDDREAWKNANPSYPTRTPARAILRLRNLLSPEDFLREALGVWDSGVSKGGIPAEAWASCASKAHDIVGQPCIAVDVALDRSHTSIVVAGERADLRTQVELVDYRPGTGWVVERLAEMSTTWGAPIDLDGSGPAASLIPDLEALGVAVNAQPRGEVVQACGAVYDAVRDQTLAHLNDPVLNAAVVGARLRPGESFVFTRKGDVDISPLYAVTLAYRAATLAADVTQAVW